MTRILALDLGTACGWALRGDNRAPPGRAAVSGYRDADLNETYHGTFDLRAGQHSGGGMRYLKFRRELTNFIGLVDEVTYEIVRRHVGTAAAHVYGGLLGILTAWCEENKIPYEGKTVQEIKKFATGKGNADKFQVIKAVEGWGFQPKNDNEADAIALLRLRLSETENLEPVIPPSNQRRRLARRTIGAHALRPAAGWEDPSSDPRFG